MEESKQALAIRGLLADGETLLAAATCQPPGAIERQAANPHKAILTDRRLIVVRLGSLVARKVKETVLDLPLAEIAGVQTRKRRPIALFGMPIFQVAVTVRNGETYYFEASGFGIGKSRSMAVALENATRSTSADDSTGQSIEKDRNGAGAEAIEADPTRGGGAEAIEDSPSDRVVPKARPIFLVSKQLFGLLLGIGLSLAIPATLGFTINTVVHAAEGPKAPPTAAKATQQICAIVQRNPKLPYESPKQQTAIMNSLARQWSAAPPEVYSGEGSLGDYVAAVESFNSGPPPANNAVYLQSFEQSYSLLQNRCAGERSG